MKEKVLDKIKKEIKSTETIFKEKIVTLVLGGIGVIAALAWNEAIKSLFEAYLPKGGELVGKFIYAIMVTLILGIASRYLGKIEQKKYL